MNPAELQRLTFGVRGARAVFCAVELGLTRALAESPRTVRELAMESGCSERGIRILLDALVGLDVLRYEAEHYALMPRVRDVFSEGSDVFRGNLMLHDLWHWHSWARLDTAVREGCALSDRRGDPHLADPNVLRAFFPNYVAAMEQSAEDAPHRLAEILVTQRPQRIVDLGGGSGLHLAALLEALPEARGILVDHAVVLEHAAGRLDPHVLRRIELRPLDLERDPLPEAADLLLLSRVLMGLPPERAHALLGRCVDALPVDGVLAVHDFDPGTRVGALLSLDMLLNTGGEVHAVEQVCAWMTEASLADVVRCRILPYTQLCRGRKSGAPRRGDGE